MKNNDKILVIGGGLSGLTAAEDLLKKHPNLQVVVLQAMDRVGGRTLTVDLNGVKFDLGGQWIGPTQQYAQQLAEQSRNELLPQYHTGRKILHFGKNVSTYKTNIPLQVGIIPLIHMQYNMWKIDKMANKLSLDSPNSCSQSLYWDSLTVHRWIHDNIWFQNVRKLFECAIRAILGVQTNEVSLLFFLWYVKQSGGIQRLINIENGLQQKKMKKGAQHLSLYLKEQIQKKGGKIYLKTFVQKIFQKEEECIVITKDGTQFRGNYLIIATPPSCVSKIQFCPPLSRQRKLICQRSFMGSCSKVLVLYEEAFWRKNGFSGETLSDCFESPIFNAYDETKTDDKGRQQPALLIFLNAGIERTWSSDKAQAQKYILKDLARYFKNQKLLQPKQIHWKVWSQEKSLGGAPITVYPPGILSQISNIRKREGRIHWAGTEMAIVSQGFMDGAIESGKRASEEISDRIDNIDEGEEDHKRGIDNWYTKIIRKTRRWFEWL